MLRLHSELPVITSADLVMFLVVATDRVVLCRHRKKNLHEEVGQT